MSNFQLRPFIYRLDVGPIPAGQTIEQIPLQLEVDSEFVLRSRAVHCRSLAPGLAGQSGLVNYFDRYTGPDSGDYLSQSLVRFGAENEDFGQYGSPLPLRPPVRYPRGGVIMLDAQNQGDEDLDGVEVYLIGQKLAPPGVFPCSTYPKRCSTLPYIYQGAVTMQQEGQVLNNQLLALNNADFVLRALTIGSMDITNPLAQYFQLYIQLRDQDGRAYSNLPVHVDACYGAFGSVVSSQLPTFRTGVYHPGLVAPEIYIRENNFLYYDLFRADNYLGGPGALAPVDVRLAFMGMKVFGR